MVIVQMKKEHNVGKKILADVKELPHTKRASANDQTKYVNILT